MMTSSHVPPHPGDASLILSREIDGHQIGLRRNGYVNATALCKAAGKEWAEYRRIGPTQEFLGELERSLGIPRDQLVQTTMTGPNVARGTWVHPDIAINLAQWCSARFAVQVSQWVRELLTTGRVELTPPAPDLGPYTHRVLQAALIEQVVPDGYWCIFAEAASVLIRAEHVLIPAGLELDADDLLDGSIGRRYSAHREGKSWAGNRTTYAYQFPPPSRRSRILVHPNAYPMAELMHFRIWLNKEYLPVHFPTYLRNKYGVSGYQAALPHIRRVIPAAIAAGS